MDSAKWCRTPAAASAARRLRPEVWKNSSTALSSNEGELARSITTCAPARALLSPSPVIVLTPVFGAAAIASWPFCLSFATTLEPIKPVPPMTTIFMILPLARLRGKQRRHRLVSAHGSRLPALTRCRYRPGVCVALATSIGGPVPWDRCAAGQGVDTPRERLERVSGALAGYPASARSVTERPRRRRAGPGSPFRH